MMGLRIAAVALALTAACLESRTWAQRQEVDALIQKIKQESIDELITGLVDESHLHVERMPQFGTKSTDWCWTDCLTNRRLHRLIELIRQIPEEQERLALVDKAFNHALQRQEEIVKEGLGRRAAGKGREISELRSDDTLIATQSGIASALYLALEFGSRKQLFEKIDEVQNRRASQMQQMADMELKGPLNPGDSESIGRFLIPDDLFFINLCLSGLDGEQKSRVLEAAEIRTLRPAYFPITAWNAWPSVVSPQPGIGRVEGKVIKTVETFDWDGTTGAKEHRAAATRVIAASRDVIPKP